MDSYMGIPYTKPIFWIPGLHTSPSSRYGLSDTSSTSSDPPPWFPFTIGVETLDTVMDVSQSHSKCCWPRTIIEARIAEAHFQLGSTKTTRSHPLCPDAASSSIGKSSASTPPAKEALNVRTPVEVSIGHQLALFLKAVYSIQSEKKSRSKSNVQRIVFKNQLPPVLRCDEGSNEILYTITGALKLAYKDDQLPSNSINPSCSDQDSFAEHKRKILRKFPMMMVIAPKDTCAAFLQSDHGSTTTPRGRVPKPQILLLKEFRLISNTNGIDGKEDKGLPGGDGNKGAVWEGIYSTFTWVLSPHGNKSNLEHPCSASHKKSLTIHKISSTLATVDEIPLCSTNCNIMSTFEPIHIGFNIFASYFHDKHDQKDAFKILMSLSNSSESKLQKKLQRFGMDLKNTAPASTVVVPPVQWTDPTVSLTRLATASYMHRLPTFLKYLDSRSKVEDGYPDEEDLQLSSSRSRSNSPIQPSEALLSRKHRRSSSEGSSCCFASMKKKSRETCTEFVENEPALGTAQESSPSNRLKDSDGFTYAAHQNYTTVPPCLTQDGSRSRARLICVGFLLASDAVPREMCHHPNAMLLYNVLPQRIGFPLWVTSINGTQKKLQPLDNVLSLAKAFVE